MVSSAPCPVRKDASVSFLGYRAGSQFSRWSGRFTCWTLLVKEVVDNVQQSLIGWSSVTTLPLLLRFLALCLALRDYFGVRSCPPLGMNLQGLIWWMASYRILTGRWVSHPLHSVSWDSPSLVSVSPVISLIPCSEQIWLWMWIQPYIKNSAWHCLQASHNLFGCRGCY